MAAANLLLSPAAPLRAHEIERLLGLDLLPRGDRKVKTPRIRALNIRLNNPTVFLSIQITALLYFLIRLIIILGR